MPRHEVQILPRPAAGASVRPADLRCRSALHYRPEYSLAVRIAASASLWNSLAARFMEALALSITSFSRAISC